MRFLFQVLLDINDIVSLCYNTLRFRLQLVAGPLLKYRPTETDHTESNIITTSIFQIEINPVYKVNLT